MESKGDWSLTVDKNIIPFPDVLHCTVVRQVIRCPWWGPLFSTKRKIYHPFPNDQSDFRFLKWKKKLFLEAPLKQGAKVYVLCLLGKEKKESSCLCSGQIKFFLHNSPVFLMSTQRK